jgi:putative solute:sodium symporter small subunit
MVTPPEPLAPYWSRVRRLTLWLLLVWALISFVPIFFARELSFDFFGWPFSFWAASQGSLVGFVAIVVVYAWRMRRLDAEYLGQR